MKPEAISEALLAASPWVSRLSSTLRVPPRDRAVESALAAIPLALQEGVRQVSASSRPHAGKAWPPPELAPPRAPRAGGQGAPATRCRALGRRVGRGGAGHHAPVRRSTHRPQGAEVRRRHCTDELAGRAGRVRAALLDDVEIAPWPSRGAGGGLGAAHRRGRALTTFASMHRGLLTRAAPIITTAPALAERCMRRRPSTT